MKTKLTVVASAILMGTALNASAYNVSSDNPPGIPAPYTLGPLPFLELAPNLFTSEKAAFALLEAAMQEAEGVIYQGGCAAAAGSKGYRKWDISTTVFDDGTGSVEVSANNALQFALNVKPGVLAGPPAGSRFNVTGNPFNQLNGVKLPLYSSVALYSATGQMMTQGASFQVKNVNNLLDNLSGTIIKDFYKITPERPSKDYKCKGDDRCGYARIPVIYDWGLQSVSKNAVPQDKWWQRSQANRSDNFYAETRFVKDRLFSAKNGGVCRIEIDMEGTNDADFFDQTGTLKIIKAAPGPFAGSY